MKKYTITVRTHEGVEMLDTAGLALMFGVTQEDIAAVTPGAIPNEWIKAGRRRAREAAAATGSSDWADTLAYWALVDHGAQLVVVAQ